MFARACAAIILVLACHGALAQETKNTAAAATPAPAADADAKAWSFDASAYTYFVPDSHDIVSPVVMADHGWLHLEARYNYENFRTGSIWFGYNFSLGEKLVLDFTAMVGGVLGDTAGVAPGYRFSLTYWKLELDERKRVRLRHSRFGGQLLLQLVGALHLAGGLVPRRRGDPEDEALRRGSRRAARLPRGVLLQEIERHRVRLQSGRQQTHVRSRARRELLTRRPRGDFFSSLFPVRR